MQQNSAITNIKNTFTIDHMNQTRIVKVKWTQEEDELLLRVVEQHGAHRWDFISTFIPGRNGRQCRERYLSTLSPNVCHEEWTYNEDVVLINLQQQIGNHWSSISKYLPGRTAIMAKNRFKLLKRRNITFQTLNKQNSQNPQTPQTPQSASETSESSESSDISMYSSEMSSPSTAFESSVESSVDSPVETNNSIFDKFDETNIFDSFDFEFTTVF